MKNTIQKAQQGFTLIELMIVVAIIGILASVAVPSYRDYIKKANYTAITLAASAAKSAVEVCLQTQDGTLANCDSGENGVPVDVTGAATDAVKGIATLAGVITVTPNALNGLAEADTYKLTPTYSATSGVKWAVSGGCTTKGLC
jgi:type IV pilus assembly protein PilA